jgi:hypothetical protein
MMMVMMVVVMMMMMMMMMIMRRRRRRRRRMVTMMTMVCSSRGRYPAQRDLEDGLLSSSQWTNPQLHNWNKVRAFAEFASCEARSGCFGDSGPCEA